MTTVNRHVDLRPAHIPAIEAMKEAIDRQIEHGARQSSILTGFTNEELRTVRLFVESFNWNIYNRETN